MIPKISIFCYRPIQPNYVKRILYLFTYKSNSSVMSCKKTCKQFHLERTVTMRISRVRFNTPSEWEGIYFIAPLAQFPVLYMAYRPFNKL